MVKDIQEVIDGIVAGDCYLRLGPRCKNPYLDFSQRSDRADYVLLIANILGVSTERVRYRDRFDKRTSKTYQECRFRTLSMPELKSFHSRWYSSGRKEVPLDFKITPTSLLHMYLCDGSFYLNRGTVPQMVICTDCYRQEDIKNIAQQISTLVAPAHIIEKSNRIRIPKDSIEKFLKFIGPSPVKSLAYKWGTYGI